MEYVGYFLAIMVGTTLGLIGGGGAILTVPILVYILAINPMLATTYSLFIVGLSSLVGLIKKSKEKNVDYKIAVIFGIPSIAVVYLVRHLLLPNIPDILFSEKSYHFTKSVALMTIFSVVMITASLSMIFAGSKIKKASNQETVNNYFTIFNQALLVGIITGLVGAGGGFLIIPALVVLIKMPMKKAVGTSFMIIAMNSIIGFAGSLNTSLIIDWQLLITFSIFSIIGIYIGTFLSKKISGEKLKSMFGWFVLLMGICIIIKEILLQ